MSDSTLAVVVAALDSLVRQRVAEALQEAQAAGPRPEGYLTTAEAATRAGVAQDTILAWISKKLLPATRPQGVKGWKIRPADLEGFLAGAGQGRGEPPPTSLADRRAAQARELAASALKGGR